MITRVLKKTYDEIARTIGTLTPEHGGMLGCSNPLGIVDRFVFDRQAKVGGAEYNPDTAFLDGILEADWAGNTSLFGFVHSHPYNFDILSQSDVAYSIDIMKEIGTDSLFMPIVMSSSHGKHKFRMVGYIVHITGKVERCKIEVISRSEYEKLLKDAAAEEDDIIVMDDDPYEAEDGCPGLSETEIMERFNSMNADAETTAAGKSQTPENRTTGNVFSAIEQVLPMDHLGECSLFVVGCGGSREFILNMVRLGIRNFYLMDGDTVSLSNICTQNAFHGEVGRSKVECIKDIILQINPECNVKTFDFMLDDAVDDKFLEKEIISHLDVNKSLLCGFTDQFEAQARNHNLSLKYGIPLLTAQHHEYGLTSEIVYYYPGISCHKPQEILESRYEAYKNGYVNTVTSFGSPIFNTARLNSLCEKIAIGMLAYSKDRTCIYSSFLAKKPQSNLLLIRQNELPASSPFFGLFAGTESSFFDDVLWLDPECNELEPDVTDTRVIYNF